MTHTPRTHLTDARVYLCTDARKRQGDLPDFLDAVLAHGVDIVQLRDKGMEAAEELEHLEVFADACARHGKLLAVNDRADVAHAARADVLHLGQGDLPVPAARAILGDDTLVGRSTHAEDEAAAPPSSPAWTTSAPAPAGPPPPSPAAPRPAWTSSGTPRGSAPTARGSRSAASISPTSTRCWTPHARRVVVVRALTEADDPGAAAAELSRRVREAADAG